MNILMVNYEFPPLGGGGGIAHQILASELSKRHRVDVVTSHMRDLPRHEVTGGVRIYRTPVLLRTRRQTASLASLLTFPVGGLFRSLRLARARRYDVVSTFFAVPSGVVSMVVSGVFQLPHVLTIIGGDIHDPSRAFSPSRHAVLRKVVSMALDQADRVVAISSYVRERALSIYAPNKDIRVIGLGMAPPVVRQMTRAEAGYSPEEFIVVSVGRLVRRKGFRHLIESVKYIGDSRVRVLIIGEGPERPNLDALIRQLDLESKVELLGFVPEEKKLQYLSIADVFVLPSIYEGFGLVFLEAMHCGLPIITTNVGGQADFLDDAKTGFLLDGADAFQIADGIKALLDYPLVRKEMSEFNAERVKDFNIEKVAGQYERVFEEAIASRKG